MGTDTERSSHKVYEKEQIGEVQIADEVVAIIAGLAATEGMGASWNAVDACKECGIDLTYHTAHRLRGGDFMSTDLFVVMEQVHKDILVGAGVNPGLVYILGGGIEDPYGKDMDAFIECRDKILASLDDLDDFLTNKADEVYRKMGGN